MIITRWTMRRFHIASFLVLFFARLVPSLPVPPTQEPSSETPRRTDGTKGEEGRYFQGDIRLMPDDDPYNLYNRLFKRVAPVPFDGEGSGVSEDSINADTFSTRLWPDGRVPYIYSKTIPRTHRMEFEKAIAEWEEATCIRFVRINDFNITEEDYLILTNRTGCSSYVGRVGGPQEVSIDETCLSKGHAMHELGHALGLWHEHSRWDRDMFIRIVKANINDNAYYNFGKMTEDKWSHIPDVGYDLHSIMHYDVRAFSKNQNPTIEVIVQVPECVLNNVGQRRMLSYKDKLRSNRMYRCPNETRSPKNGCPVDIDPFLSTSSSTPSPSPSPSPIPTVTTPPPPPPPPPPPSPRLMSGDNLKLNTNRARNESLHCTASRCKIKQCTYNRFIEWLICDDEHDLAIHLVESRKNKKVRDSDSVALQSLHKRTRWVECSGQNICAITPCHDNDGSVNTSNVSQCTEHRFIILSVKGKNIIKDGDEVKFKHPTNDTYLYCTKKQCKLLPECPEGEQSNSADEDEMECHAPTLFLIEKLYS